MKIIQISKRLNNWEADKTKGNECLIDLPISLKGLLFNNQEKVFFADKREENEDFNLTYADRNWIRIPKKYYNKYYDFGLNINAIINENTIAAVIPGVVKLNIPINIPRNPLP